MALLEGVVTIDAVTGAVTASTGAAGAVFTVLDTAQDYGGAVGIPLAKSRQQLADLAASVAALVPYFIANADVATTVASGIPVLVGGNAGTTTSPGSGTGSLS